MLSVAISMMYSLDIYHLIIFQVKLTLPIYQTILTGHQITMTTVAGLLTFIRPYLS